MYCYIINHSAVLCVTIVSLVITADSNLVPNNYNKVSLSSLKCTNTPKHTICNIKITLELRASMINLQSTNT